MEDELIFYQHQEFLKIGSLCIANKVLWLSLIAADSSPFRNCIHLKVVENFVEYSFAVDFEPVSKCADHFLKDSFTKVG